MKDEPVFMLAPDTPVQVPASGEVQISNLTALGAVVTEGLKLKAYEVLAEPFELPTATDRDVNWPAFAGVATNIVDNNANKPVHVAAFLNIPL